MYNTYVHNDTLSHQNFLVRHSILNPNPKRRQFALFSVSILLLCLEVLKLCGQSLWRLTPAMTSEMDRTYRAVFRIESWGCIHKRFFWQLLRWYFLHVLLCIQDQMLYNMAAYTISQFKKCLSIFQSSSPQFYSIAESALG